MNSNGRPSIPAELKRRILVEAGHRCAIPTCRNIVVDIHHIIPWEKCQKHEYENLIALCPNCHRLVGEEKIDRKSLKMYKANLRFAIEKYSQFEMDVLFELSKVPSEHFLPFPFYLCLLIKRILDAGFVEIVTTETGAYNQFGVKMDPDRLVITDKGREFIKSLGLKDIGY